MPVFAAKIPKPAEPVQWGPEPFATLPPHLWNSLQQEQQCSLPIQIWPESQLFLLLLSFLYCNIVVIGFSLTSDSAVWMDAI